MRKGLLDSNFNTLEKLHPILWVDAHFCATESRHCAERTAYPLYNPNMSRTISPASGATNTHPMQTGVQ